MAVDPARAPLADAPAGRGTALLIVDMISTWDFPDADRLAPRAAAIAPRIGALKRRCARAGMPAIYVNDNRERWRSEFREIARLAAEASATGTAIARSLAPGDDDYAVLKPKHSVFFATPLDLLLRHLRATRLIITGVASDLCVVMSAAEARMRDYEVIVPGDCVAALTAARNARALRHLGEVHGMKTTASPQLRLPRRPARRAD
jgi:nicotinamidase-related amidase